MDTNSYAHSNPHILSITGIATPCKGWVFLKQYSPICPIDRNHLPIFDSASRAYHIHYGWQAILSCYNRSMRNLAADFEHQPAHQWEHGCPARIGRLRDQNFACPQRCRFAWSNTMRARPLTLPPL